MDNKLLYKVNIEQKGNGSWLYAYGLLAGRENRFFNETQLQQLFNAGSKDQLLNVMREANYHGDSIEEALINSKKDDIDLLHSLLPDFALLKVFLLFNEGHNLKVIIRATLAAEQKVSLADLEHLLLGPYLIEPEYLLATIRNSNDFELPKWMLEAIEKAKQEYLDSYDMSRIDLLIDKLMWQELMEELDQIGSDWLKEYYLLKADLINLEILFRVKNLNLSEKFFKRSLLPQGNLPFEKWLELFRLNASELSHSLEDLKLSEFAQFIDTYHELGKASVFSQLSDQLLMQKIRETKFFSSGIEKVAAYYLVREIERTNIKLARASYYHSIPAERSEQIARPCYLRRF